ncbi:hypothetical protein ACE1TF_14825 [Geomicrobium sp. JSM 1781026]|uniref:hypothetical protein n=1 Tax=Geomicrobium sp. JSM 1781026 TaxID=3344580 RepID=UPI0035C1F34B
MLSAKKQLDQNYVIRPIERRLTAGVVGSLLLLWGGSIWMWLVFSGPVVVHWGINGYSYGAPSSNLWMSVTFTVLALLLLMLRRWLNPYTKWTNIPTPVTKENAEPIYRSLRHLMAWLAFITALLPLPIFIEFLLVSLGVNVYLFAVAPIIGLVYPLVTVYYLLKISNH